MLGLSIGHWIIVLVVVVVLFGPKRLPELGASLGEGIRNFKKGLVDPPNTNSGDKIPDKTDDTKLT